MVCLGNICRSPMAHGILEKKVAELNLGWEVDSAGTSAYHRGEAPDNRAIETAAAHDIDITGQKSRQLLQKDMSDYDLIITMDTNNYNNTLRLATNEAEKAKVKLLLNYSHPKENRAVPDPYYSGGFDYVYRLIEEAVAALIADVTKE
ncbi:low molecular weight phosphotyrosine protein phosphatase [Saprospiraceae bacterium]|nr:low molecular weight phosphotyrosine protein phosphatase [Saprospiraceae bacterium]